jgi:2-hydroxy-3-keto-5-methylthiopentenyl-1-phosphate phosphatase
MMKYIFFIDFDGTITNKDTCEEIIETFCDNRGKEINEKWENKEISTEECARQIFNLFSMTHQDLFCLLDNIRIDPYFPQFVQLCNKKGHNIYIISDGYNLIIQYLLQKNRLSNLPFFANNLIIKEGRCFIKFPYKNEKCGKCGTCKKRLLISFKSKKFRTVYIGDGFSDTCACQEADLVFAKNNLLAFCQKKGIPAISFNSFYDVLRYI